MSELAQFDPPDASPTRVKREPRDKSSIKTSSPQVAHTLTACCRCRARKTRCDPGLPRCGPCERTNSHCEYYDQTKGTRIPRNYVVHLQHKIKGLEKRLAELEKDDLDPDPEDLVRGGAAVRIQEHDESKFLGPSSGIAITRLVMQLAKQFTDSKSITDIVPESRAMSIAKKFHDIEEEKPTSKIYPLISDVAAEDLPQRDLTNLLVQLFMCKVMAMYPLFHEQTFWQDVDDVYSGSKDPFQNFALRMVIAVSLQRMDTQYAGLADSYYLAALRFLENTVKPMNIKTIQCFCLIGAYSLLTPTRTAVYYVVGLAARLCQALGLCEEKTIQQGANGRPANFLEIDMKRRVFWCAMVMEFGLAHSLGRPSCLACSEEHIDVQFFEMVDDEYITKSGVTPGAPRSLKKWIAIHFFRMRLLQLEIRRKMYQSKRPEPRDDQDPWFKQMEAKLVSWRDTSPEFDAGSGLDKVWFIGRYNTMVVFLCRPSPQIPRPSLRAAQECFAACKFNIYMHRQQINSKSVEMTWIFTQSIFMAINTILWTLSYYEIRQEYSREEVLEHLSVALECIDRAILRWPGVASALDLYNSLIDACIKIYDKDGDIPIAAGSPAESSVEARSRTSSPVTAPSKPLESIAQRSVTPPVDTKTPFGYILPQQPPASAHNTQPFDDTSPSVYSQPQRSSQQPRAPGLVTPPAAPYDEPTPASSAPQRGTDHSSEGSRSNMGSFSFEEGFDPNSQFNPLPTSFNVNDLGTGWNPSFSLSQGTSPLNISSTSPFDQPLGEFAGFGGVQSQQNPVQYSDYLYPPSWNLEMRSPAGLNQEQQSELMHSLETSGTGQISQMIQASNALFYPHGRGF